jgi:hypothetical protein
VAISRAEDHLRLYHTCQAKKEERAPSPFIAELGEFETETLAAPTANFAVTVAEVGEVELDFITFHDIRDFEKCPLRVAYRHQLSIRSRRHESPHQMTGGVIYELIDRVSEIAGAGPDLAAAIEAAFGLAWEERGPAADHPLAGEYEAVGRRSIADLRRVLEGQTGSGRDMVRLPIQGGHVLLPAPLFSTGAGGARTARMVVAGKRDTANARALTAGLFLAAAKLRAEQAVAAEIAHLTGGDIIPILRTDAEAASDLEQAAIILDAIRTGRLEPKPRLQVCMRCGHFMSCPATGARPRA